MNYKLGAKFCRNSFKNGGVCIFTHESIQFTNVSLIKFCKEKYLEICAVEIHLTDYTIYIMAIYQAPSGNFLYFLNNLETILNMIYENSIEIIICGEININYLNDSTHKQLLDSLLASYCLYSTVQFPTRIHNNSFLAIDNIFINNTIFHNFSIYPFVNGMSDHDAQIIVIHNFPVQNCNNHFYFSQKIDKCSIIDFNTKLSYGVLGGYFYR
jgi:hypothetical protein